MYNSFKLIKTNLCKFIGKTYKVDLTGKRAHNNKWIFLVSAVLYRDPGRAEIRL